MSSRYERLGLKVGLEIHQQLATNTKLFCDCKPGLSTSPPETTFYRRLRPTQSELGAVDPAAAYEFQRGRGFVYEADNETSCLVEMDEEPPHTLSAEAADACLAVALMLGARPVDEIHVMRKVVIDGSNTTGFQRTCIIALGGELMVEGKRIGIQAIYIEEDAARKTDEEGTTVHYRIDRLCVPLIEIATAPEITSPQEAEKVALALGRVLRATRKVRRGLGTIRQDLNVSITRGALMEIKGVQELDLVALVVEAEIQRQVGLLGISEELNRRGLREEDLEEGIVDVSEVFRNTKCKVLKTSIEKGSVILALKLPKFSGLLGRELSPKMRFGTELSDHARFWGRAGGIFHTDELPAYGITEDEVIKLRKMTKAEPEDAVVVVAQEKEDAVDALHAVLERAKVAITGVPSETRAANPDGTTHFSRPRPGASRMYPETDVPPVVISAAHLAEIARNLPLLPDLRLAQIIKQYGLNEKLASQVLGSEYVELFEKVVQETHLAPTFLAATLVETLKSLSREGLKVSALSAEQIYDVFKAVDNGAVAKEAIPEILSWLAQNSSGSCGEALKALGLGMVSREELEAFIDRIVNENMNLIKERGNNSIGALMGTLMREFRGRIDAKVASDFLRRRIGQTLGQQIS